jgi:hypothetical protein
MSPNQLSALYALPGFPAFGRELIRVAGLTAAARLIGEWGGQEFRIPASVGGGGSLKGERRWAQLAEVAGEEAAERMVRAWPGEYIYIPICGAARGKALEARLKKDYDGLTRRGYSHRDALFELVGKYQKNYRSIERTINRPSIPETEMAPAQLRLEF